MTPYELIHPAAGNSSRAQQGFLPLGGLSEADLHFKINFLFSSTNCVEICPVQVDTMKARMHADSSKSGHSADASASSGAAELQEEEQPGSEHLVATVPSHRYKAEWFVLDFPLVS